MSKPIVGVIGGTGLDDDLSILSEKKLVDLEETPYGWASDRQVNSTTIDGVLVYFLSRHGPRHDVNPSHVNYRANIWSLVKQLKCTHILVTSACGSLKEEIKPGHIGILDQYIDRTCGVRERSFYRVCHVEQRNPINKTMQGFITKACEELMIPHHKDLTCVTIEGPRFSTLAESKLHQSWGCDIVNMTSVPEVQLASELGAFYASILLVTDYDCWRENEEGVSADQVIVQMRDLGAKARKIIPLVIKSIGQYDWSIQRAENEKKVIGSMMAE